MRKYNFKKSAMRIFAVLLALFSFVFVWTREEMGGSFGDSVFESLGLPAWSNGTQGAHYSAIFGLIMLVIAIYLFASTTKEKLRTFRLILIAGIAACVLGGFLNVML